MKERALLSREEKYVDIQHPDPEPISFFISLFFSAMCFLLFE